MLKFSYLIHQFHANTDHSLKFNVLNIYIVHFLLVFELISCFVHHINVNYIYVVNFIFIYFCLESNVLNLHLV